MHHEPPLGAHVSIAGGLHLAVERGVAIGCTALQIFVKNASQWRARPLAPEQVERWHESRRASTVGPVVAHASYLINLAATDAGNLEKSRQALADELSRCAALGLDGLVVHPGAHLGAGEEAGIERIGESLRAVLADTPDDAPRVLLENTAGQGTVLGYALEQLAAMRDRADAPERVGFCLDTCHAFAAGYAVHTEAGLDAFLDEVETILGLDTLGCLHLNDSARPFDSRRDRHANLGAGEIGLEPFARLLVEPRLRQVPMILETPVGDDGAGHRRDLERLRQATAGSA